MSSSCIPLYSTGGSKHEAKVRDLTPQVCCISGQNSSLNFKENIKMFSVHAKASCIKLVPALIAIIRSMFYSPICRIAYKRWKNMARAKY